MVMFQATAMLQDAAPATPVTPKGAGFKADSGKGGEFQRVLQGRQSSAEDAAPRQGGKGADKSAPAQAAAAARPAQKGQTAQKTLSRAVKKEQMAERKPAELKEDTGQTPEIPAKLKVAGGKTAASSQKEADAAQEEASSTAAGQETAAETVAKAIVPIPGAGNGNPNLEGKTVTVAEEAAAAVETAGERAAGPTRLPDVEEAVEVEGGSSKVAGLIAKVADSEQAATAKDTAAVTTVKGAHGQEVSRFASQNGEMHRADAAQPAPQQAGGDNGKAAAAGGKEVTPAALRSQWGIFYQPGSNPAQPAAKDETAAAVTTDPTGAAGTATMEVASTEPGTSAQAEPVATAQTPTAAPEGAQKEMKGATVDVEVAPAKEAASGQEPGQDLKSAQETGKAQSSERKEGPVAETSHRRQGIENAMPERQQAAQGTEEGSTPTGTQAGDGVKLAAAQGKTGQEGSGDAAGKGHQEQNAHVKQGEHLFNPGIGGQTTAADAAPVETRQGGQRTALHESILSQVKEGVVSHDGKGNGQVSIRLSPDDLGELTIQVRMENNKLTVEVQADNRMVKDLLMSNLDSLKDALSGKNFTMTGFDVSTGGSGAFDSPFREQREGGRQQAMLRGARNGYGDPEKSVGRVKYLTAEVNNLLDVRF